MGFYNLPKDQQDQYNTEPTHEQLMESWQKAQKVTYKRDNKMISLIDDESLKGYIQRATNNDKALEEQAVQEHMYGIRGAWYVHKRSANCFICDLITCNNQKLDILTDLLKYLPKQLLSTLTFATNAESQLSRLVTR